MSQSKRLKRPDAFWLQLLVVAASMGNDARAATVSLGTADHFAVLAATTITNAGISHITGDLGLTPGTSVTGLAGSVTGTIHIADATAVQAQTDATSAFNSLSGLEVTQDLSGIDLGGLVLTPGVYKFSAASQLTGTLILNGMGQTDPLFVFQIGTTLTTASAASFVAINGASASNTYFQVGTSATLGTGTKFAGNILAAASATITAGSTVDGRILAAAAVTLDNNEISLASTTGTTWGLTKTGGYTLNLLKANSYSGTTTLDQGVLQIGVDSQGTAGAIVASAVGSDLLVIHGGNLSSDGTAARTVLNQVTFSGDSALGNAVHNGKLTFGGAMDLAGATRVLAVDSDVDFNGVLSNGGLTKNGSGRLALNGESTYIGTTTIPSGILMVNGSLASGSTVTVAEGGSLKGGGVIGGGTTVSSGGVLAPGDSTGILAVLGDTSLAGGSIFEWQIDSASPEPLSNRGTAYDGLDAGSLTGSDAIFRIVLTGTQDFGDEFWNSDRSWSDIFKSGDGTAILANWASVFGGGVEYSYNGQTMDPVSQGSFNLSGNTLAWSAVPEPGSALAGLLLLLGFVTQRNRGCTRLPLNKPD